MTVNDDLVYHIGVDLSELRQAEKEAGQIAARIARRLTQPAASLAVPRPSRVATPSAEQEQLRLDAQVRQERRRLAQQDARETAAAAREEGREARERGRALIQQQRQTLREAEQLRRQEGREARAAAAEMRRTIAQEARLQRANARAEVTGAHATGFTMGQPFAFGHLPQMQAQMRHLQVVASNLRYELAQTAPGTQQFAVLQAQLQGVTQRMTLLSAATADARRELQQLSRVGRLNSALVQGRRDYEDQFGTLGGITSRVGMSMMLAGGALAFAGKYFTDAAVQAVEAENLFEVTFEQNAAATRAWSETLATELGRNKYKVREFAAQFAAVFKPNLGLERATEMSTALTRRAYDIESLRNINIDEVMQRMHSVMAGEVEAGRRLGIDSTMPTLKLIAAAHGMKEFGAESDEASKRLMRFYAIMEQTGDALGDIVRTADEPANRIRAQKEKWEELRVEIGIQLIPVLEQLLDTTGAVINWLDRMSDAEKKNLVTTLKWVAGTLLIGGAALSIVGPILQVLSALAQLNVALGGGAMAAGGLAGVLARLGPYAIAIAAVLTAAGLAWGAYTAKQEEAAKKAHAAADAVKRQLEWRATMASQLESLGTAYDTLSAKTSRTADEEGQLVKIKGELDNAIQRVSKSLGLQVTNIDAARGKWKEYADMLRNSKQLEFKGKLLETQAEIEDAKLAQRKAWNDLWQREFWNQGTSTVLDPAALAARVREKAKDDPGIQGAQLRLQSAQVKLKAYEALGTLYNTENATPDLATTPGSPDLSKYLPASYVDIEQYSIGQQAAIAVQQAERNAASIRKRISLLSPTEDTREERFRLEGDLALAEQEAANARDLAREKKRLVEEGAQAEAALQQDLARKQATLDATRKAKADDAAIEAAETAVREAERALERQQKLTQATLDAEEAQIKDIHDERLQHIRDETEAQLAALKRIKEAYDQWKASALAFAGLWLFQNPDVRQGIEIGAQNPIEAQQMLREGHGYAFNLYAPGQTVSGLPEKPAPRYAPPLGPEPAVTGAEMPMGRLPVPQVATDDLPPVAGGLPVPQVAPIAVPTVAALSATAPAVGGALTDSEYRGRITFEVDLDGNISIGQILQPMLERALSKRGDRVTAGLNGL